MCLAVGREGRWNTYGRWSRVREYSAYSSEWVKLLPAVLHWNLIGTSYMIPYIRLCKAEKTVGQLGRYILCSPNAGTLVQLN